MDEGERDGEERDGDAVAHERRRKAVVEGKRREMQGLRPAL